MRHERVESVLMVHIEAVSAEPGGETEQPAQDCDGCWTGRRPLVRMYRRLDLRETFAYSAARWHLDEHRAYEIAHCRAAARATA